VQLVFKISNLYAPDPATLQTDRQTDDMQSQYRALHYSASRGKKQTDENSPCGTRLLYRPTCLRCQL